jgi:hypothetical protein
MALSGGAAMCAIAPLMGVGRTSIRPVEIDTNDPICDMRGSGFLRRKLTVPPHFAGRKFLF